MSRLSSRKRRARDWPFASAWACGPADQNWKRQLNRLIQENQPAINKILLDFGVPLLDENDRPIGAETATKVP